MDTRIVWFRRDLRVADNPALTAVAGEDEGLRVVPLFVLDPRLVRSSTMSPARLSYLCDALADLDGALRDRGARLVIRHGDPREVVPAVAGELHASEVHFAHDITPFATGRDAAVTKTLEAHGVLAETHPGIMIRDAGTVRNGSGHMFRVYSPFRRAWEALDLAHPVPTPAHLRLHGDVYSEDLPTTASLGVADRLPSGVIAGGETTARKRRERFLADRAEGYAGGRDMLGEDGTSRLSADLHYGCVSPLETYHLLDRSSKGHDTFAQELIWRDFYGHVMAEWPEVRTTEFNEDMRGLPWRGGGEDFDAWAEGRTGYPIVDAGMRQLRELGWMHNRARMVTASFLCKDLLVDWRLGEAHFLRHLIDGDVASNNGGWQWAAGTGTDAQPYFRIFNPVLQGQRFDRDGAYVRRNVPELGDVPKRWIHHPWDMPDDVARAAGVVIGETYPAPIVDHREARARALEFFSQRG